MSSATPRLTATLDPLHGAGGRFGPGRRQFRPSADVRPDRRRIEVDTATQRLRLKDVVPQVLYFSDRPERVAGHVDMAGYLEEWTKGKDNFGEDPPNATLSVYEPGQSENTTVVIEIMQPKVEGKDISYSYKLINGEMPAVGQNAALFIDWIGPGGGVGAGFHGVGVGAPRTRCSRVGRCCSRG